MATVLCMRRMGGCVRNLYSSLKPGGCLQWIDIDTGFTSVFLSQLGSQYAALFEINGVLRAFDAAYSRDFDGFKALRDW
jgi:hypothetical protein